MRQPNFITLSVWSLPVIQFGILTLGMFLNKDLSSQLRDFDGSYIELILSVAAQGFIAWALGVFTYLASYCPTRIYRWLYFFGGSAGIFLFGWLLKNSWTFESNHCTSGDGCDKSSPLKFDFMMCVLLGLPMLWCLGLTGASLFVRELMAKRTKQLERYF